MLTQTFQSSVRLLLQRIILNSRADHKKYPLFRDTVIVPLYKAAVMPHLE